MPDDRSRVLLNHVQRAIENAVVSIAMAFVLGGMAGWGLSLWSNSPVESVIIILLGVFASAWIAWAFHRTNGLLHHSGFRRHELDGEVREPQQPGRTLKQ